MADNWQNLAKNATDPQTIEEYIAGVLLNHNDDAEAHMGPGGAIENHRENDVLDHPAQSIVTDKIEILARTYAAIVDPANEEAFDTLEAALVYVDSIGGGSIYLASGTHYFVESIEINPGVSLYGAGIGKTIVLPQNSGSDEVIFTEGDNTATGFRTVSTIQDMTIGSSSNPIQVPQNDAICFITFRNVAFAGWYWEFHPGSYIENYTIKYEKCLFVQNITNVGMVLTGAVMEDCHYIATTNISSGVILENAVIKSSTFEGSGGSSDNDWFSFGYGECVIRDSIIKDTSGDTFVTTTVLDSDNITVDNCKIEVDTNERLYLNTERLRFINNHVQHSAGYPVTVSSGTVNVICGFNNTTEAISNSGTGTQLIGNIVI